MKINLHKDAINFDSFLFMHGLSSRVFFYEEYILKYNHNMAYYYAVNVIKGRWPEAEPLMLVSAEEAYWYASDVIKKRFRQGESIIAQDGKWSFLYASHVIRGRFPEGEPAILTGIFAKEYCREFLLS